MTDILRFDRAPALLKRWSYLKVNSGDAPPPGYGFAYKAWNTDEIIVAPIPFNFLVTVVRAIYFWLRYPPHHDVLEDAYYAGFAKGQEQERAACEAIINYIRKETLDKALAQHRRDIKPVIEGLQREFVELRKELGR